MVKLDLEPREIYLTFLAVEQAMRGLMQYPDPLHEQHKAEYSQLATFWAEALEQPATKSIPRAKA